jgi:hypothetical protein
MRKEGGRSGAADRMFCIRQGLPPPVQDGHRNPDFQVAFHQAAQYRQRQCYGLSFVVYVAVSQDFDLLQ